MDQYGTSIQIDTAAMASVARIIDNQRLIIENGFSSIFADARNLRTSWEGESADAYQTVMKELDDISDSETAAAYIVSALRDYVTQLNNITAEFDTTERNLKTED